ncbi:hypothetical protein ABMA27_010381 [Loxostege sticticalis]|uniref:Uncharacterized protein n=1 Tax=Loxostege sticticalis TaxID=481309 RepID=A0ABR3H5J1_LOXSC
MDLPLKKKYYAQKYRSEWENMDEFKGWLKPASGDSTKAFCTYCSMEILAKLFDIKKHAQTKKHKHKLELKTGRCNKEIPFKVIAKESSSRPCDAAEGALTLFIAEHCSTLSVDHLGELCSKCFKDSKATDGLKLHRTKCTEIMKNVLTSHFRQELLDDIGNQKFSILLDESTDVSVSKHLGLVIRYYSSKQEKIVSSFLELVSIERADAKGIVEGLVACLENYKLNINQMIGIGTDNASVMTGINNGVHAILKRDYGLQHLILIRCVWHSLQLPVTHASENSLPRTVEFLVREIYKWFSVSPKRRDEYKKIYELINCGEAPLKITKVCDTRWLSIEPAVTKILSQWEELKLHFNLARGNENCYAAELIYNMLQDNKHYLYLIFLRSVLNDVQIAIKAFEGEDSNPLKLLNTLKTLIQSVSQRILMPTRLQRNIMDPITDRDLHPRPFLGYIFETEITKHSFDPETSNAIRQRCVTFLMRLVTELQQRLPDNYKQLESMQLLSPEEAVKPVKTNDIVNLAEILGFTPEKIDKIMQQWHILHSFKWVSQEIIPFWVEVKKYKNASGDNILEDISELAIACISLPHSNAEVEKLFSQMNLIKNKQRNRMSLITLNSILCIRDSLRKSGQCCHNYVLPKSVLDKMGTMEKYSKSSKADSVAQDVPSFSQCPQPSTSSSCI